MKNKFIIISILLMLVCYISQSKGEYIYKNSTSLADKAWQPIPEYTTWIGTLLFRNLDKTRLFVCAVVDSVEIADNMIKASKI